MTPFLAGLLVGAGLVLVPLAFALAGLWLSATEAQADEIAARVEALLARDLGRPLKVRVVTAAARGGAA